MLRQNNWRILYEPTTKRRRRKLRKGFTALLTVLLTLSLCACAKNNTKAPSQKTNLKRPLLKNASVMSLFGYKMKTGYMVL